MNFNRDDSTPIRFVPGREDKFSSDNNEVGTRPAGDPKSRKSFQKILNKDSDAKDEGEGASQAIDEEEGAQSAMVLVEEKALKKKKAPSSLFELSAADTTHSKKPAAMAASSAQSFIGLDSNKKGSSATDDDVAEGQVNSPVDLYSKITTKEPKKVEPLVKEAPAADHSSISETPVNVEEKKDKYNTRFATEQPDLSYVNPMALNVQTANSVTFNAEKPILTPVHIEEIINQLVERVVQLETGDKTDTIITLKQPPILAGADLIVTGFNSAKGEFNITFQKLSQAAKELLDMRVNQQSLLLALEQKGYAVHIITNTTLTEINLPAAGVASTPQDRNREQEKDQSEQQRRDRQK